jgi:hypothetical protein
VINAHGLSIALEQVRRDGRSLLQYVDEAFPYTPAAAEPARHRLAELAREEQQAVGRLMRFLQRHHVTLPLLGAFPSNFTTINFVSLDHLLPVLVKDERHKIAELERRLASLPESELRRLLWEYLEMKRRHLHVLEEIGACV